MSLARQLGTLNDVLEVVEVAMAAIQHQAVDIDTSVAALLMRDVSTPLCAIRDAMQKALQEAAEAPEVDAD